MHNCVNTTYVRNAIARIIDDITINYDLVPVVVGNIILQFSRY